MSRRGQTNARTSSRRVPIRLAIHTSLSLSVSLSRASSLAPSDRDDQVRSVGQVIVGHLLRFAVVRESAFLVSCVCPRSRRAAPRLPEITSHLPAATPRILFLFLSSFLFPYLFPSSLPLSPAVRRLAPRRSSSPFLIPCDLSFFPSPYVFIPLVSFSFPPPVLRRPRGM